MMGRTRARARERNTVASQSIYAILDKQDSKEYYILLSKQCKTND